jgi:hypothetical protein
MLAAILVILFRNFEYLTVLGSGRVHSKSWYHSVAPIYSWKGLEKCAIGQELADLKCGAFDMSETFARISGIDVMGCSGDENAKTIIIILELLTHASCIMPESQRIPKNSMFPK